MTPERRRGAIVLFLIGTALAALLLFQHHGEGGAVATVNALCGDGQTSGCEVVSQSAWSKLAGVPLAALGLFFYLGLASLLVLGGAGGDEAAARASKLALGLTLAALAADVVLLGLQAFVIKHYCGLCLATYGVNAAAAAALWPARQSPASALGRVVASAWAVALAALGIGVFASNAALEARATARAGTILGAPASLPAGGDAGLRAEVKRLQDTLDDPQKFQDYQAAKAERDFETAAPQTFDLSTTPLKGPVDARVQVIEFSDFLCPFCRGLAGAFKDFMPRSQGRIAVLFKNYPLDKECNPHLNNTIHPGACWVARGGVCAQQQGKFWAYHDRAFENPPQAPGRADVVKIATDAGLDAAAMASCLDSPAAQARLAADIADAERTGVKATPTLFINGKKLPRVNDFLLMVEKESKRLGLPPLNPAPAGQ
jgi:protein-disulfide isomerase